MPWPRECGEFPMTFILTTQRNGIQTQEEKAPRYQGPNTRIKFRTERQRRQEDSKEAPGNKER